MLAVGIDTGGNPVNLYTGEDFIVPQAAFDAAGEAEHRRYRIRLQRSAARGLTMGYEAQDQHISAFGPGSGVDFRGRWPSTSPPSPGPLPPSKASPTFARGGLLGRRSIQGYGSVIITPLAKTM